MDDKNTIYVILAVLFGMTQLFGFHFDLIDLGLRKKHPTRIEKSENVSYPEHLTVFVWHHRKYFHGYKKYVYIRKENNKYKKDIKLSAGYIIWWIFYRLLILLLIFAFPICMYIRMPDFPYPELMYGFSAVVLLVFCHNFITGPENIARMTLKKYLREQAKGKEE